MGGIRPGAGVVGLVGPHGLAVLVVHVQPDDVLALSQPEPGLRLVELLGQRLEHLAEVGVQRGIGGQPVSVRTSAPFLSAGNLLAVPALGHLGMKAGLGLLAIGDVDAAAGKADKLA